MINENDYIDPNEHVYITMYRESDTNDHSSFSLPDLHCLQPWARDRLHRQAEAARRLHIIMRKNAKLSSTFRKAA